jgi:uncharacterized protein (UPF0248 family)
MKRGYKYEKEMLHWLDGGEIEQKTNDEEYWRPFDGYWYDEPCWQYRIAESRSEELLAEKQRWLYVVVDVDGFLQLHESEIPHHTIGKIRMEEI